MIEHKTIFLSMVWRWFWGICRLGWMILWVLGCTFIPHISNITTVSISDGVCYNLGTAIRKSNTVFTCGGSAITSLISSKVSL